ncbi:MAG: carbohydrate ABC transporter permease, partial [Aristaeellaceae bacterium]
KARYSYLMLAPYLVVFFVFTALPVGISVWNSLTYNNFFDPARFVGFDNYIRMFTGDDVFLIALRNTLLLALITGPIGYGMSFLLAWQINNMSSRLSRSIFVLLFYAPTMTTSVYTVWTLLFSNDEYGYVNGLLMRLGMIREAIQWLADTDYMMMVVIICVLWTSMGAGFLSFVAGFRSMDKQYYEAGQVDGIRNRWQELWYITLPMMRPQLMFGAIMSITAAFSIHDVTIALMGFPSTDYAVHTVVNHLYDYGYLRFDLGYASAISTVLFLLMMGTNMLVGRLLRKVGQ